MVGDAVRRAARFRRGVQQRRSGSPGDGPQRAAGREASAGAIGGAAVDAAAARVRGESRTVRGTGHVRGARRCRHAVLDAGRGGVALCAPGGYVRMRWLGANPNPVVVAAVPQATRVNYARGRPEQVAGRGAAVRSGDLPRPLSRHRSRLPRRARLARVRSGGRAGRRSRRDSPALRRSAIGTGRPASLHCHRRGGEIIHRRPIAFQDVAGEHASVPASYTVTRAAAGEAIAGRVRASAITIERGRSSSTRASAT